ncbi:hypothetical protein ACIHFE_18790 [Streptomyces sp. NPDC052396]|uniref:hypothetical protein n=1 Tax=Streptomyces sp. NPDC052396 TaxID=3365689 RepID=UPI0037D2AE48
MPMTLPVPIEFSLPEGWLPLSPEGVEAQEVAFAAVYPHPDAGFTPNICIDGAYRPDATTLADIADESVRQLREAVESVEVNVRRETGSADAPGLMQRLAISDVSGDVRRDLVQSQAYLTMADVTDPRKRVVIRLALTATKAQHDSVLGDFQDFVRTVRPHTGARP